MPFITLEILLWGAMAATGSRVMRVPSSSNTNRDISSHETHISLTKRLYLVSASQPSLGLAPKADSFENFPQAPPVHMVSMVVHSARCFDPRLPRSS
jgi:hypothetical protein